MKYHKCEYQRSIYGSLKECAASHHDCKYQEIEYDEDGSIDMVICNRDIQTVYCGGCRYSKCYPDGLILCGRRMDLVKVEYDWTCKHAKRIHEKE